MKKIMLIGTSLALISASNVTHAVEIAGKKLEIYGKVHLSIDASDPDAAGQSSQTSISNNSSRLGFKGEHTLNDSAKVLWKYEQGVNVEETGGTFASRNTYLGLTGHYGTVLVGHHDTPSKTLGSKWGMFSDTVGDRRAIFGAYSGYGNKMNDRGENAILYKNKFANLELQAMYSASNPTTGVSGSLDDNSSDLTSVSLTYNNESWNVGVAAENWSKDPENAAVEVDNIRFALRYSMDKMKLGFIYESTDSVDNVFNRDAYGVNALYKVSDAMDIRLQHLIADSYEGQTSSGATQTALGVFNKLDKVTQVYAVYTSTSNEANASYQGVDGGHGDELTTVAGGSPSAISVGAIYKF